MGRRPIDLSYQMAAFFKRKTTRTRIDTSQSRDAKKYAERRNKVAMNIQEIGTVGRKFGFSEQVEKFFFFWLWTKKIL